MGKPSQRQRRLAFEKEWQRNATAQPGCHDFMVVCDHLKPDFNIGKIFRSAEAFGAQGVHLVGIGYFSPYPARGALRQVPAQAFDAFDPSYQALRSTGYQLFRLDPHVGQALTDIRLPAKSAFVLGHEEFGYSFDVDAYPDVIPIRIPMYGRVESLNVSVAASIVMYEYVRQHGQPCPNHEEKDMHHAAL